MRRDETSKYVGRPGGLTENAEKRSRCASVGKDTTRAGASTAMTVTAGGAREMRVTAER
jgi:hypothetical protein